MGESSLPTSRDSIRSSSSQETAGGDSTRQRSVDGSTSMAGECKQQAVSQAEMNQNIKPSMTATTASSVGSTPTVDPPQNHHHIKSESSLDSIVKEANQGLYPLPSRYEQPPTRTIVVDMPPEKPGTSQTLSEPRSATPSDLSNAGSAPLSNSASSNPKQIVQQHPEKPPPAPILKQNQQQQQPQGRCPSLTTPATLAPSQPGKSVSQQPSQPNAPQPIVRTGSRFTITPVASAPPVPVQPPIQQPQDRRPSLAMSTATTSSQQSVQSALQHTDALQSKPAPPSTTQPQPEQQQLSQHAPVDIIASQHSNTSQSSQPQTSQEQQPQHEPIETIAPLPATPASVPTKTPHPQALKHRSVSVPCAPQPYPPEYHQAQAERSKSGESQTAYFCHLPGVIPFQTMPQTNAAGGRQPQDQMMRTVGAIPIMNIQQDGVHYVKKGRFKLFQQMSPAPAAPAVVSTPAVVQAIPETVQSGVLVTQPLVPSAPIVASSDESLSPKVTLRSMEPKASGEQSAKAGIPGNTTPLPETFDGSSVPTVTKKGRFLVSNVKDVRTMIPTQKVVVAGAPVEAVQLPTMTQPAVIQQPIQPLIAPVTQAPMVQPVTQAVVQTTIPVQRPNNEAVPASHPMEGVPVATIQTTSPFFSLQGTAIVTESYPRTSQQPEPQPQTQLVQSHRMTHGQQVPPEVSVTTSQTPVPSNVQASTAAKTAGLPPVVPTSLANESLRRPMHVKSLSENFNGAEKARMAPAVPTKKAVTRTAPHAMDRGGKLSLGKLSYLLDQMKSEVTDADLLIRNLQTDLKLMVCT